MKLENALRLSHMYISKYIKTGDIVVDATCGNGHDTVFLSKIVGEEGKVYAFDIQQEAINNTLKRLKENNCADNIVLLKKDHSDIDKYINTDVNGVMFNLGYLPKGDHSIATNYITTISAIEKSLLKLKLDGVISIVVYHGQDSGFEEKEKVIKYIENIDPNKYSVMISTFPNQINHPPIHILIKRER